MSENRPTINTRRDIKIVVPIDTTEIQIRELDWRRIYRKVKSSPRKRTLYLHIAGILFGVGVTTILSLPPLYWAAQNVSPWVKPAYWIIGVTAFIISFITWKYSKEIDEVIESSCLEVQQDMKEINSMFFPNDNIDADKNVQRVPKTGHSKDVKTLN